MDDQKLNVDQMPAEDLAEPPAQEERPFDAPGRPALSPMAIVTEYLHVADWMRLSLMDQQQWTKEKNGKYKKQTYVYFANVHQLALGGTVFVTSSVKG